VQFTHVLISFYFGTTVYSVDALQRFNKGASVPRAAILHSVLFQLVDSAAHPSWESFLDGGSEIFTFRHILPEKRQLVRDSFNRLDEILKAICRVIN
jgi:hypothetical protein